MWTCITVNESTCRPIRQPSHKHCRGQRVHLQFRYGAIAFAASTRPARLVTLGAARNGSTAWSVLKESIVSKRASRELN